MTRGGALQPGKTYHIYNRGNNRENIFVEERNYRHFLDLYARHIHPIADTYAFCLMRNHFHLLVRMKSEDELAQLKKSDISEMSDFSTTPTRAFAALFTAYTKGMNKVYQRTGRLFQEHFGRIEVASDIYFTNLIFYIHFNPQKHGFVTNFRDWPWSSYSALVTSKATRLQREAVLDWFGSSTHLQNFHNGVVDEKLITPLTREDFE